MNRAFSYESDPNTGEVIPETKMVFWKPHYMVSRCVDPFYLKPLFTCPTCMASVYSLLYWLVVPLFYPLSWGIAVAYVIYIPVLSGMVTLINSHIPE